jgi:hypothetical protein
MKHSVSLKFPSNCFDSQIPIVDTLDHNIQNLWMIIYSKIRDNSTISISYTITTPTKIAVPILAITDFLHITEPAYLQYLEITSGEYTWEDVVDTYSGYPTPEILQNLDTNQHLKIIVDVYTPDAMPQMQ